VLPCSPPHDYNCVSPLKVAVAGLGFGEKRFHLPARRRPGTEPVGPLHPAHRSPLKPPAAARVTRMSVDFRSPARDPDRGLWVNRDLPPAPRL